MHRGRHPPPWSSLGRDVLALCMSFCNAADLLAARRSCAAFREAARLAVARAETLNLSFLMLLPKLRKQQEHIVARLLEDAQSSLRRLELAGLSHVKGAWLEALLQRCSNLTSLDLSGCSGLDPRLVQTAVEAVQLRHMKHLNLQGCRRVDNDAVLAIAKCMVSLQSLQLGGCSQTIDAECFRLVRYELKNLTSLDITGLKRIRGVTHGFFVTALPDSIEYLSLAGCGLRQFYALFDFFHLMHDTFFKLLRQDGGLGALVDLVHSSDTEQLWNSLLHVNTHENSRLVIQRVRDIAQLVEVVDPDKLAELVAVDRSGRLEGFWNSVLSSDINVILNFPAQWVRGIPSRGSLFSTGWNNLRVLDVSHVSVPAGSLGFIACFSGGVLREVNISGCERICSVDIQVLATACANSLTCLEARGCRFGDLALKALGTNCTKLAELDISACFEMTQEGLISLCPHNGLYVGSEASNGRLFDYASRFLENRRGCPALRSLKLANLSGVTDDVILAIGGLKHDTEFGNMRSEHGGLKKLLLLDVSNCPRASARVIGLLMKECHSLIELDARGIQGTVKREYVPRNVRFLNGRRLSEVDASCSQRCCTVLNHSKRLKASQRVELQPMYHCVDCKLLPSSGRGMCSVCATVCHDGHETYLGSLTRFYCDCAFGISGDAECKALSRPAHVDIL